MQYIDVVGTGFTVLDRIYGLAKPVEALGGSCGNVLLSLAMLKRSVAPVLALGEDEIGLRLTNAFSQAGANVRYISRRPMRRSPILVQKLDDTSGDHSFSFVCPESNVEFSKYEAIDALDVRSARDAIGSCLIFYADRLSHSILEAMQIAFDAGALIYFEPSEIEENELFSEALSIVTILKYSSDRIKRELVGEYNADMIILETHGSSGLEVIYQDTNKWCPAIRANEMKDACGAGDMVSVGVIDRLLSRENTGVNEVLIDSVVSGAIAGQRLAAANCQYIGARGLFENRGSVYAREVLALTEHAN